MKKLLFAIGLLLACTLVAKADFRIYTTVQITNAPVQSNTITIGTNVIQWRTNITNNASWVLITNTVGGCATNLRAQLVNFPITNVTVVDITNTSYLVLLGGLNSNLVVTTVGSYARVTTYTSTVYAASGAAFPFTKETDAQRVSYMNNVVTGMNAYATQSLTDSGVVTAKLLSRGQPEGMTNKLAHKLGLMSATNYGEFMVATGSVVVLEGADDVDYVGTYAMPGNAGFWFEGTGQRVAKLGPYNSFNPYPSLFDETGTNAFDFAAFIGNPPLSSNLSNKFGATLPVVLNLASALGYFPVIGWYGVDLTNVWVSSQRFAGIDFWVGTPSTFTAAIYALGTNYVNTLVVTNTINVGVFHGGTVSNVALVDSTISNVVTLGGSMSKAKSLGTFDVQSDMAYTVTNFTSLAAGNNISVDFGNNVFVRIGGALAGDGSICGIINGRSGKFHLIYNDTAANVILSQSTADSIVTNRFQNYGGLDMTIPPQGWGCVTYESVASRWKTSWTFPTLVYATNAIASNAVASLNGLATNLTHWGSITWTNGSGSEKMIYVASDGTFSLRDAPAGGSGVSTNFVLSQIGDLGTNASNFANQKISSNAGSGTNINLYGTTYHGTNSQTYVKQLGSNSMELAAGATKVTVSTNAGLSVTIPSATSGGINYNGHAMIGQYTANFGGVWLDANAILTPNNTNAALFDAGAGTILGSLNGTPIMFDIGGIEKWRINTSSGLIPATDLTADLGSSSARLRDGWLGRALYLGSNGVTTALQGPSNSLVLAAGTNTLVIETNGNIRGFGLISQPVLDATNLALIAYSDLNAVNLSNAVAGAISRANQVGTDGTNNVAALRAAFLQTSNGFILNSNFVQTLWADFTSVSNAHRSLSNSFMLTRSDFFNTSNSVVGNTAAITANTAQINGDSNDVRNLKTLQKNYLPGANIIFATNNSTNVTISGSASSSTSFTRTNIAVWTEDFSGTLGNWVSRSNTTWTISGGALSVKNPNSESFGHYLIKTNMIHGFSHWTMTCQVIPVSISSTSYGIGFGILSANTHDDRNTFVRLICSSGNSLGTLDVFSGTSNAPVSQAGSSFGMSMSAGDLINLTVTRKGGLWFALASNTVNGTIAVIQHSAQTRSTNAVYNPCAGYFAMWSAGGTQTVDNITFSLNPVWPVSYLVVADSIGDSVGANNRADGWVNRLKLRTGDEGIQAWASPSLTLDLAVLGVAEMNLLQASNLIFSIGGNDILFGVPTASWTSNYYWLSTNITHSGTVYHCEPTPRTATAVTNLCKLIITNYQATAIDTYSPLKAAGTSFAIRGDMDGGDGTHPNSDGHATFFEAVYNKLRGW